MFPLHPLEDPAFIQAKLSDPEWIREKQFFQYSPLVIMDLFLETGGGLRVELNEAQSVRIFKGRLKESIPAQSHYEPAPYVGNATWTIVQPGKISVANVEVDRYASEKVFRQLERELAHQNDSFQTTTIPVPRITSRSTFTNLPVPTEHDPASYHKHVCETLEVPINTVTEKFPGLKTATGEALDAIAHEMTALVRTQPDGRPKESDDSFRERVLRMVLGLSDQP